MLTLVPFFAVPIFMSGCSGCEEVRLVRTCPSRTAAKIPCTGTKETFEELKESPDAYNVGACSIGTIQCRRETETKEDYCSDGNEDCLDEWTASAQFEEVCIGYKAPEEEKCGNDLDDDCDGEINEGYDLDGDGWEDYHKKDNDGNRCGYDCDDLDSDIHPDSAEVCDGKDNNCNCLTRANLVDRDTNNDGVECGCSDIGCDYNVDEQPDGLPISTLGVCYSDGVDPDDTVFINTPCQVGELMCRNGNKVCEGAKGPEEELCDGIDNNCNGFADEPGFVVSEGDACGSSIGVCEQGQLVCNSMLADMVCWGATTGSFFDACNGLDDDCDTEVDEDARAILCQNGCPVHGFQYCVDGEYSVCDAPGPVSEDNEPCNGLDDDCDGIIDEGQECECFPLEIGPNAPICTVSEMQASGLTCGEGRKNCECVDGDCQYGDCYLACDAWVDGAPVDDPSSWWLECPAEVCDTWDHNCSGVAPNENIDGLIDVPCLCDLNSPIPEISQTARNGSCEEGLCTAGQQTCEYDNQLQDWRMTPDDCDAVGPIEEVCDELDNDCDGVIDNGLNSFERVDMVFAIDITGSMVEEIQAIHTAISEYALGFAQTEHRFALVLFPAPFGNYNPPWSEVGSPAVSCVDQAYWTMTGGLVDVGVFLDALQTVLDTGLVCGGEPSYDVLAALTSVADPAGIGWRADAYPYIFILGDEAAQTWVLPVGLTENDLVGPASVCNGIGMCPCVPPDCPTVVNEFEIHCFITTPTYISQYDNICYNDVVGDNVYDINGITAGVLRNIFADVCLPGDGP